MKDLIWAVLRAMVWLGLLVGCAALWLALGIVDAFKSVLRWLGIL